MRKMDVILIADDEEKLLSFLKRNLEARGFKALTAMNGFDALRLYEEETPNLLVLDIMMPRMDGLEVCRRVRERSTVPIIVLTALDEETDRVVALDLGADDYITKPFGIDEFLARVRAVLRRSSWNDNPPTSETVRFSNIEVHLSEHRVLVNGEEVRLTPTEYELLKTLIQAPNKAFTHRELLLRVWGNEYGNEAEYLRVYMNRLRRKIEKDPNQPRHLLTEVGFGYRFCK
jgi:two-component system KDP operon response regulator KdpE